MDYPAWVRNIVDTTGRPCALFHKKCPGTTRGCAQWIEDHLRDASGNVEPVAGCLFGFTYVATHEVAKEAIRTQAALDKTATVLQNAGRGLTAAVATHGRMIGGST